MSDQTCPMCEGYGVGGCQDETPCPDCKGTGRVPATEPATGSGDAAEPIIVELDGPVSIGPLFDAGFAEGHRAATADAQAEIARLTDKNLEWLAAWNQQHAEIARLREALDAKHEREESEISAIVEERDRLRGELAEAREDRDFAIGREHSALDSLRRACDERNALTAELAEAREHAECWRLCKDIIVGTDLRFGRFLRCFPNGMNTFTVNTYIEDDDGEPEYDLTSDGYAAHTGDTPELAVRAAAKALGIEP